jgi:Arc/MetJ family transcription regulator
MRTNIELNDMLIREALELGGYKTKREAVEEALKLLVRLKKQNLILKYKGKLKWEGDLDKMRTDL